MKAPPNRTLGLLSFESTTNSTQKRNLLNVSNCLCVEKEFLLCSGFLTQLKAQLPCCGSERTSVRFRYLSISSLVLVSLPYEL